MYLSMYFNNSTPKKLDHVYITFSSYNSILNLLNKYHPWWLSSSQRVVYLTSAWYPKEWNSLSGVSRITLDVFTDTRSATPVIFNVVSFSHLRCRFLLWFTFLFLIIFRKGFETVNIFTYQRPRPGLF